jgi:putative oxidoreductase
MFAAADGIAARSGDIIALIARILIGWLFLTNGWAKLTHMAGTVSYLNGLHVPAPELFYWPAMVGELLIGVTLILGIAVRYASLFTIVYLIIATLLAHRYWDVPAAAASNQYAHFCKNLAIMGGAALLYFIGAGRFSLDAWLRRR